MSFVFKNIFLILFFIFSCSSLYAKELKEKYIIATATSGGTFFPVGVAIATIASLNLSKSHNMVFSAVTSAGSCENIDLLVKNEVNFGILQGLCGSMAWQGKGKHQGEPKRNLRSISTLWENVEQFTVKSEFVDSGNIKDLKNLYNQKFSIGGRSSGSRVSAEIIFNALDIQATKMDLQYFGYSGSSIALKTDSIAGMNTPAGIPTPAVSSAFESSGDKKLRILEFTQDDLSKINANYPVWRPYILKSGTYPGQTQDIQTISQPNLLVVSQETPEEVVYLLTKTIYENLDFLQGVHEATKNLSLKKSIVGLPIPLHNGAIRYYEEKGIKIPSTLKGSK
jgi:uncharacterized protein